MDISLLKNLANSGANSIKTQTMKFLQTDVGKSLLDAGKNAVKEAVTQVAKSIQEKHTSLF